MRSPAADPSAQARPAAAVDASHRRVRCPLRPGGTSMRPAVRTAGVRSGHAPGACGHCGGRRTLWQPRVSGGYRKRSPAQWPLEGCRHRRYARSSWRWELGAHVGHGRALQRQDHLDGQPAKPQPQQVAAPPAGHDHTGDHLRVDA
jgi:hypothetical protein